MDRLYLDLEARVVEKAPEIKHIDLWNNQIDNEEEQAFPFPCLFVEFSGISYTEMGSGIQEASLTVRVRVGLESYKNKDLSIYALRRKINGFLMGFVGPTLQNKPFVRVSEEMDTNHDNRVIWVIDYTTTYMDYDGYTKRDQVPVNASLEIEKDLIIDSNTVTTIRTGKNG